jgi:hypothetical protein
MLPCRFPYIAMGFTILTRLAIGEKTITHLTAPALTKA